MGGASAAAGYDRIDYLRWAQRSLNRIMGRSVLVDGRSIGPWRAVLGDFKRDFGIKDPGLSVFEIGANTQNQMIRMNHLSPDYQAWLAGKLPGLGGAGKAGPGQLEKAIRAFQAKHQLKQDGWVGHATEAALVARYGAPPGNGGPPPQPAPEWLQLWNALPVQVRYARWISDMAARVGADQHMAGRLPEGGWDPVYKHFLGILARNAKATPKLVHFYFTDNNVSRIAAASMPLVVQNPPKKAPGGGKLVHEGALRQVAQQMSTTQDLFRLAMGTAMTPAAYAASQHLFEERVFQTYQAIRSGFMKLAFLGAWGNQGFFDAKYAYILIIISTLSLREESVYSAFRHNLPNPASWEAPKPLAALLGLD
jgi:peptidoglycan hydrolase-like protein with peptidoglycan-binding domain